MSGKGSTNVDGYVSCPVCCTHLLPTKGSLQDGVYAADCVNCGHFFKFRSVNGIDDAASSITFKVNGKVCTVGNEHASSTSLLQYLRQTRLSVGTKGTCLEGGCGVCLVSIKLWEPVLEQKIDYAVNSCLVPLYSCDGYEITTIESLGNPRVGLHPIQERLAQKDGAQCGYCSSGQVMNMFGLLKGNPKPTMKDVEDGFDATICRCTGYRPILDAMKSFAVDADESLVGGMIDIEDLEGKVCKGSGQPCSGHCSSSPSHNHNGCSDHWTPDSFTRPLRVVSADAQWIRPTTRDGLATLLKQYKSQNYRLVFGNSGFGVYKELSLKNYDVIIDLRGIKFLYGIDFDPTIVLGSNLSIHNLLFLFDRTKADPSIRYAGAFAEHLRYVAMQGVRNLGCWAGNLMLKHHQPGFQSDIFTLLETIGTKLLIMDEDGNEDSYSLPDFLHLDMKGKVILAMLAPTFEGNVQVRTYRAARRLQACHSYVVCGIMMDVDASQNFLVKSQPSIVMAGINDTFIHATQTEKSLVNKKLGDPAVLKATLSTLASELVPSTKEGESSAAYRKSLGLAMFYKYCLDVCQSDVDPRYVSGGQLIPRPLMTGTQDYGTNKAEWPVNEPMPKTIAGYLTSGSAMYLDDVPPIPGELAAAVVISSVANAKITSVDASAALAYPGVVAFIQASDIPKDGVNNWRPKGLSAPGVVQELLSSGFVYYAGQPIGIIVADLESTAQFATSLVKVEYTPQQPVVTDLRDAMAQKRFFPHQAKPTIVGDPKGAIASAPHKISGTISCGDQYHFHMESQTSICTPKDVGGMKVKASTQWLDGVQETVSQVLGMRQSQVTVEVERLGGAFGGKISQNYPVSGLCALASYIVGRSVKLHLDIHTNMKMLGKRVPYLAEYQVGVDDGGKLLGVDFTLYEDCGAFDYEAIAPVMISHVDNAYYCANWLWTPITVRTDKPVNTACRAPASVPVMFHMETIMDHVAKELNLDPLNVRKANLYVKGQKTPCGDTLEYCTIRSVVTQLEKQVNLTQRKADVDKFNQSNRWKKRGISVMPNRFGIDWRSAMYNTTVTIYHGDGSVSISHGGIDSGQGINTKAIQVCAYELGIPMDGIRVMESSSVINANSITTGGSITSELCAKGVIECCNVLKARMLPVKQKMKDPTWIQLVTQCYADEIDLMASYMTHPDQKFSAQYSCYSASVVEAEIDVLTGQYQLRQLDMLYDSGESLNPELDIGQAEGAFLMGVGYFLMEEIQYDSKSGEVINAGTWEYKPPLAKDLPLKYNFTFQRNVLNPLGVLNSKAIGEPPLTMSAAAFLAVKHAIESARLEVGHKEYFPLNAPATVDKIQTMCLNDYSQFVLKPSGRL